MSCNIGYFILIATFQNFLNSSEGDKSLRMKTMSISVDQRLSINQVLTRQTESVEQTYLVYLAVLHAIGKFRTFCVNRMLPLLTLF
jgi:hypothetical protein